MKLYLDCSLDHLTVALAAEGRLCAGHHEARRRGHAEHLIATIDQCLGEARCAPSDLTAIIVTCGPGNFTGVRIGLAAARALALALPIEAVGMTTLAALGAGSAAACLALIEAPQGRAYAQCWSSAGVGPIWRGDCDHARAYAQASGLAIATDAPAPGALMAAAARLRAEGAGRALAPLYLRAADARPAPASRWSAV